MRIMKLALAALALLALLAGCGAAEDPETQANTTEPATEVITTEEQSTEEKTKLEFDLSMLMGGYYPFDDNPIDAAFEADVRRAGATMEMVELAAEHRDAWRVELDGAYTQMLNILRGQEKTDFIKAQSAWNEYMEAKYAQLRRVFYPMSEYQFDPDAYGGPGSLDRVIITGKEMREVRSRALELMEQVYFFTGEVQFFMP